MDTVKWYEDPVYIKMCDCPEIQDSHEWALGDYCKAGRLGSGTITCIEGYINRIYIDGDYIGIHTRAVIWLPTQSDLQEMVSKDVPYLLGSFFRQLLLGLSQGLDSMEQLWLSFCLKTLYNKVWLNDKWEVSDD